MGANKSDAFKVNIEYLNSPAPAISLTAKFLSVTLFANPLCIDSRKPVLTDVTCSDAETDDH